MQKARLGMALLKVFLLTASAMGAEGNLCADRVLAFACKEFGLPEPVDKSNDFEHIEGTTLAELERRAIRSGFSTETVWADVEDLSRRESVQIVHLKNEHYVIVERLLTDGVVVIDPPGIPAIISRAEFLKTWSGAVLRVWRPGVDRKHPLFAVDHGGIDLGRVRINESRDFSIGLLNISDGEQRVGKVAASCGCIGVSSGERILAPLERLDITGTFRGRYRSGVLAERMFFDVKDPMFSAFLVPISGEIGGGILAFPDYVNFGRLLEGENRTKTVQFESPIDPIKTKVTVEPVNANSVIKVKADIRGGALILTAQRRVGGGEPEPFLAEYARGRVKLAIEKDQAVREVSIDYSALLK